MVTEAQSVLSEVPQSSELAEEEEEDLEALTLKGYNGNLHLQCTRLLESVAERHPAATVQKMADILFDGGYVVRENRTLVEVSAKAFLKQ